MTRSRTRTRVHNLLLGLLAAVTVTALVGPAAATGSGTAGSAVGSAAPSSVAASSACDVTWGSLAKSGGDPGLFTGNLTGARAGSHACFDRLVLDLGTHATKNLAWSVRYAAVRAEGTGARIPLRGAADLEIRLAGREDEGHVITFDPRDDREVVPVRHFRTFRQVAWAGDSADGAHSTFGLGVRARLPFRAFTLSGGGPGDTARLVVDVAHRW